MSENFSTTREFAAHYRISYAYARKLIADGLVPHYKIGKSVRLRLSETDEAMKKNFWRSGRQQDE